MQFVTLDTTDPQNLELDAYLEEFEHQDEDYTFKIVATLGTYGTHDSNTFQFNTASSCEITTVQPETSMAQDLTVYIDD